MDKGAWHWKRSGPYVDVFSSDFTHDVALRISGDFVTSRQEEKYAEWLCARLNDCDKQPNAELMGRPLADGPA